MNYLVFDVGGSAIKYALMDDDLKIIEKGKEVTPRDSLASFKEVIRNIYLKYENQIEGIAMSLPGLINKKTNQMQIPGALRYNQDVEILKELKSVTMENFTIENDAKCAAFCEVVYGSLQGVDVGAACILGTGIGGAITIGDKVFVGSHGFAGEFSYMNSYFDRALGWDEKWATRAGVFKLFKMIASSQGLDDIDGYEAFELCNNGNKEALKALEGYCDLVAAGLFSVQTVVDPEVIAIGGGISKQPILLEYLEKSLNKLYDSISQPVPRVKLVRCKFYNDSNLIGALANYKRIMGK